VIFLPDQSAASEAVLALETVGGVFHEPALNEVVAESHVVTAVLCQARAIQEFGLIERTHAVQGIFHVTASPEHIYAVLGIIGKKETIDAIFAFIQIIATRPLAPVVEKIAVPDTLTEHFPEFIPGLFVYLS
jgi:hypothetical protein